MRCCAVGAKTARACDYCVRRRARFYCGADDAFLCQACDASVHSANALARRHERVRLNTASLKCSSPCIPSWHRGQRRARTPRHAKQRLKLMAHVPELGQSTTTSPDHDYDQTDHLQLLYMVPVLNPLVADLCTEVVSFQEDSPQDTFLPLDLGMDLDMDMEEFAADVESFLGKGLEGEGYVKAEEETMPFELSFDYSSPVSFEEADVKDAMEPRANYDEKREWRMSLSLDYEAISAAWASQGSPWMNGERPQINPNDSWFHGTTMASCTTTRPFRGQATSGDGGREARVLRYREKRRTRLFSKKIRYEVRKLNAEKRPRMKGRFVKRSSFNPTPTPFPLLTKT